jgi:hypothetical protein
MREEGSQPLFIPSRNLYYRYYRWISIDTTGQVDNPGCYTAGTTGGEAPVLPVVPEKEEVSERW